MADHSFIIVIILFELGRTFRGACGPMGYQIFCSSYNFPIVLLLLWYLWRHMSRLLCSLVRGHIDNWGCCYDWDIPNHQQVKVVSIFHFGAMHEPEDLQLMRDWAPQSLMPIDILYFLQLFLGPISFYYLIGSSRSKW